MNGPNNPALYFPDVEEAGPDGLLAIGGDLSIDRLLLAYSSGIFPWYEDSYPILWWSPDPRMILFPKDIRISHSLKSRIKKHAYEVRIDTAFERVIRYCANSGVRKKEGTWITNEMIAAYEKLHDHGYAHSFETWLGGKLVGGLYGVSLGRAFFGESMFFLEPDASKIALVYLAALLKEQKFDFIDVQQETPHLKSMGAITIPRPRFMNMLRLSMQSETIKGKWTKFGNRNELLKNVLS
jgi:leucyl/phenylalanyl-tRNA---protein transferase